jgi:phenylalanyl-tRNA synthetase beta chain
MKISLNSIKSLGYADLFKLPLEQLTDKIGTQLGALEAEPVNLGKLYDGVYVAKVVACEKHPGADRLHVCLIDDGGVVKDVERNKDGLVQVVCGAPNVKAGMLVAWLPPKSTVPSSIGKEPFVLEARELRGVVSNGMLASANELSISDNHEGILEIIPEEVGETLAKPGTEFRKLFGLDDHVLNIENKMFTHRPDCFGYFGIAREIAGIQGLPFTSSSWYISSPELPKIENNDLSLTLTNEIPGEVPRFVALTMNNVSVGPSPIWLQALVNRLGVRPINNVVDVTNYFMLLTGQPLHAYDYDKVKALSSGTAKLVVRYPHAGEKITLLSGKTIEPRVEAIMIATDKQAIGIGGVMGGADTEVGSTTKNIILESANFNMYSIRRTSMSSGIFSDAVSRFNKGQSPLQNLSVALKAAEELSKVSGATLSGKIIDDIHLDESVIATGSLFTPVKVSAKFINSRLGIELSQAEIKKLLENVEFKVDASGDDLTITAPFWRTDIEIKEDIVEEVGRLYGYDKVPLNLPTRGIVPAIKDSLLEFKSIVREALSKAGANEVLTYSFIHGNLLDKVGQDKTKAYALGNALSPDLQYYRISLLPSLLDKVHPNIKAGYDEFALFELGKTHSLEQPVDSEKLPSEYDITALVVAASDKLKKSGAAYYQARKYLSNLAEVELVFSPIDDDMKSYAMVQPYDLNRSALVSVKDGEFLGIIGEFKSSVAKQLKLPKYCAGFEVDTLVLGAAIKQSNAYVALPKFPKVTQDITMKVGAELSYQDLYDYLNTEIESHRPENALVNLDPVDIFQKPDEQDSKQISFRLTIASYERTLTDTEVNKLLDTVADAAQTKLSATRI